jgi:ABC-type amino acid transport substrate-binding protein
LSDSRVKAAIAINPITSLLFGPEGLSQIKIPTMLISGNDDIIAPALQEQIHPFVWQQNTDKYLALFVNGTHFSIMGDGDKTSSSPSNSNDLKIPKVIIGPDQAIGRSYAKALSIAFMEVYLRGNTDYQYYLTNNYAVSISQPEMSLAIVSSLAPEELEAAFGKTPPEPIIPEAITETVPIQKSATVLADIQKTGVLKVGIRKDAAPFGFINAKGEWRGYCQDFMKEFRDYLVANYDIPSNLRIIPLDSNLRDRFQLVENQSVHLECGPNSLRKDLKNIVFSAPFAVTGTQFLIPKNKAQSFDLQNHLEGWKVGLLKNSLTEQFMKQNYDSVKTTPFTGELGRAEGVQALVQGKIDAFVSDGILLQGELARQGLASDNYSLVPERPLTCDFYSMILPNNDPQWQKIVNDFILKERLDNKGNAWLAQYVPQILDQADYCLNK